VNLSPSFTLVIFDCDGVLVDSERLSHGVLRDMLIEMGADISFDETVQTFIGTSMPTWLPGQDPAQLTAELVQIMNEPAARVEPILSWQAHVAPIDTPLFEAIKKLAAERDPGAGVGANVIGGFTDCNAFRAHGLTCYGFIPMRISLQDIGRMHGHDERIRISALSGAVLNTLRLAELLD
jgi:hypothetical protein